MWSGQKVAKLASNPDCPAPAIVRTFFKPQLLVTKKGEKKKSNQCWWSPRAPNTRSETVSGRGPWDPGSLALSPEWNHVMCFWKDLCFRKLCSMSCASLDGRRLWGRMDTCIHMAKSLCCPPETITALLNGYRKWKWSRSVVSDSWQPHGLQPTRLLRLWDFPGKSTGVGCHWQNRNGFNAETKGFPMPIG